MNEPWLTGQELAAELRCSRRTVQRIKPPGMLVGGQMRYKLSEVEAYLRGEERRAEVVALRGEAERFRSDLESLA